MGLVTDKSLVYIRISGLDGAGSHIKNILIIPCRLVSIIKVEISAC